MVFRSLKRAISQRVEGTPGSLHENEVITVKWAPTTCQAHGRHTLHFPRRPPSWRGRLLSPVSLWESWISERPRRQGRADTDLTPSMPGFKAQTTPTSLCAHPASRWRLILKRKLLDKRKDSKMHCFLLKHWKSKADTEAASQGKTIFSPASIRKALKQLKKWSTFDLPHFSSKGKQFYYVKFLQPYHTNSIVFEA